MCTRYRSPRFQRPGYYSRIYNANYKSAGNLDAIGARLLPVPAGQKIDHVDLGRDPDHIPGIHDDGRR